MQENETIDCIKDVTIAYNGGKIPVTELDFLNGNLPDEIHFYEDTFELKTILQASNCDNDGSISHSQIEKQNKCLENWICQRWCLKEEFLKKYFNLQHIKK